MDADAAGHVYFSGEFTGAIRLGATTLTSAGGTDLFVAKATSAGRIQWAVSMGGPGDEIGPEIEVDARGAVLLAGTFAGQARFGSRTLTAAGLQAAFVARLTSRGRFTWVAGSGAGGFTTLGELAIAPGPVSVLGPLRRQRDARAVQPARPWVAPTSSWRSCRPHSEASPCSVATSDRGPPASRCSQR